MKSRLTKLRSLLVKNKLSGLILRVNESGQSTQPNNQNVLYMSGFGGSTGVLLITKSSAFIIVDARYWARAQAEAKEFTLVKVQRGKKFSLFINEALKKAKLTKRSRVGFESHLMPYSVAQEWMEELNCNLQPASNLVGSLRQYKDEEEIKLLKSACRKTSEVYLEIVDLIVPGMREVDVALEIDSRLRKKGASDNSFQTIVASGPNSAIPHHATGRRKLKAGEPVVMDFGGVFEGGYCSDITRTIFVKGKKPSKKLRKIYEIVLEANKRARKALNPEMKMIDYDRVAREFIVEKGYGEYFTHGLGHSLGLEAHDPFDYANAKLEVGSVVTDEPGIYIEDVGGVRIEDDLVVTAGGAKKLTNAPYWKF